MTRSSPKSLDHARRLRKDMTDAERTLWRLLRDRRMDGWRFRRQEPIDRYIVDFVRVLRLWNTDVLANRDGAYRTIIAALARCAPDGAAPSSSSA
jgi:very-short-patch-repair endonuclease